MDQDTQYRILIVDDEKEFVDELEEYMARKRTNWITVPAYDGVQALDLLQKDGTFDAAVIDLKMPGICGEELLEKIVEQHQHICPIFVTAYGDIPKAVFSVKIGACDFQPKPINPDRLIRAIEEGITYRRMSLLLQDVLTRLNTEEVLNLAIQIAELRFQLGGCYPAIFEERQQQLTIKRAEIKDRHIVNDPVTGPGPKFVRTVLDTKRPLRLMNISPEENWETLMADAKSLVATPLQFPDNIARGVLSIENIKQEAFSIKDLIDLRMIASFTSIALNNAEEHERTKKLAATMAHEVRNILQPALTAHGFLKTWPQRNRVEYIKHLDTIHECLQEANEQMIALIDFAHAERLEMEKVDIRCVADDAIGMLRGSVFEQGLTIETKHAVELPSIPGNGRKLREVFYNLVKNAAEAIVAKGEPGRITVQTASDEAQHSVMIRFADTGIGIQPENLPKIFGPYFTTKTGRKGFGLGLAHAKRVVEQHGGSMEVKSHPASGSVFTVYLPIREE